MAYIYDGLFMLSINCHNLQIIQDNMNHALSPRDFYIINGIIKFGPYHFVDTAYEHAVIKVNEFLRTTSLFSGFSHLEHLTNLDSKDIGLLMSKDEGSLYSNLKEFCENWSTKYKCMSIYKTKKYLIGEGLNSKVSVTCRIISPKHLEKVAPYDVEGIFMTQDDYINCNLYNMIPVEDEETK